MTDGPRDPSSRRLFSPTSEAERARTGKQLLWALPVALAVLGALIWLGPDAETIERKFTPYGNPGPLRLMPEISIEDDTAPAHQRAAAEATPPPTAPRYAVEPEDHSPEAEEIAPRPADEAAEVSGTGESAAVRPETDAMVAADGDASVDMDIPSQHADSDFIIRKLVRPLYPARASHEDRLRPVITVVAAFFLDQTGTIEAVMIQSNEGGPEFAAAVREAMEQWEFAPRMRDGQPPAPRWLVVTWHFRSPFSAPPGG